MEGRAQLAACFVRLQKEAVTAQRFRSVEKGQRVHFVNDPDQAHRRPSLPPLTLQKSFLLPQQSSKLLRANPERCLVEESPQVEKQNTAASIL